MVPTHVTQNWVVTTTSYRRKDEIPRFIRVDDVILKPNVLFIAVDDLLTALSGYGDETHLVPISIA